MLWVAPLEEPPIQGVSWVYGILPYVIKTKLQLIVADFRNWQYVGASI